MCIQRSILILVATISGSSFFVSHAQFPSQKVMLSALKSQSSFEKFFEANDCTIKKRHVDAEYLIGSVSNQIMSVDTTEMSVLQPLFYAYSSDYGYCVEAGADELILTTTHGKCIVDLEKEPLISAFAHDPLQWKHAESKSFMIGRRDGTCVFCTNFKSTQEVEVDLYRIAENNAPVTCISRVLLDNMWLIGTDSALYIIKIQDDVLVSTHINCDFSKQFDSRYAGLKLQDVGVHGGIIILKARYDNENTNHYFSVYPYAADVYQKLFVEKDRSTIERYYKAHIFARSKCVSRKI
jgi:hypothetical protein